jgi:sarcosine oxidase gamma subunit
MTAQISHSVQHAAPGRRWPLAQPVQTNTTLRYEDLSWRARFGCKGPQAESWLTGLGLEVPQQANSAQMSSSGVLVARLARTEFLVEAVGGGSESIAATARQLQRSPAPAGVYPVTRQDVVLDIDGAGCNTLLRQICSVDFAPLLEGCRADGGPVVLTSMVGVSVVAWPHRAERGACLTLWFDPSFGHYFCSTLLEVGSGIGGEFSAAGRKQ